MEVLKHKHHFHYNARAMTNNLEITDNNLIRVDLALRKAERDDLAIDKKNLRIGQPLWVRSLITGNVDNHPIIISNDIDRIQLTIWFENDQLYVPASSLDCKATTQETKVSNTNSSH